MTTVTVQLSEDVARRLDALAKTSRRSPASLAAEAIEAFVEVAEWQLAGIRRAVDQADAGGPFIAHDDMRDYIDALARGEEPLKPATFKLRR